MLNKLGELQIFILCRRPTANPVQRRSSGVAESALTVEESGFSC